MEIYWVRKGGREGVKEGGKKGKKGGKEKCSRIRGNSMTLTLIY